MHWYGSGSVAVFYVVECVGCVVQGASGPRLAPSRQIACHGCVIVAQPHTQFWHSWTAVLNIFLFLVTRGTLELALGGIRCRGSHGRDFVTPQDLRDRSGHGG